MSVCNEKNISFYDVGHKKKFIPLPPFIYGFIDTDIQIWDHIKRFIILYSGTAKGDENRLGQL